MLELVQQAARDAPAAQPDLVTHRLRQLAADSPIDPCVRERDLEHRLTTLAPTGTLLRR